MKFFFLLFVFGFFACSSFKEKAFNSNLPEIQEVYYQKWVAGVQGGGSGINFHVVFNKPLLDEYELEKVWYDTHEEGFEKLSDTEYIARIKTRKNDFILDENYQNEYSNKAPNFRMRTGEANLIFKFMDKEFIQNIKNIKERQKIAYPSMPKPTE